MIEGDHEYLSTAWLEYFHSTDRDVQMRGVAEALDAKLTLRPSGRIGVLNVGEAIQACQQQSRVNIEVWLLDESDDPSHTGIYGYKDVQFNLDPPAVLSRLVKSQDIFRVPTDLINR